MARHDGFCNVGLSAFYTAVVVVVRTMVVLCEAGFTSVSVINSVAMVETRLPFTLEKKSSFFCCEAVKFIFAVKKVEMVVVNE